MRLIAPATLIERPQRAHLWRDDLRQIVEIVRSVDAGVLIRTDKYLLDDIDELGDVDDDRIARFIVTADGGRIKILFGRVSAELSVEEPSRETRGMVAEIVSVLNRRRAFGIVRLRRTGAYAAFAAVLSCCYFLCSVLAFVGSLPDHRTVYWLTLAFALTALTVVRALTRPPGMVMYTRTRAERPPWLERNRDALLTNAIVSAVFLVVGIILGYLLPK